MKFFVSPASNAFQRLHCTLLGAIALLLSFPQGIRADIVLQTGFEPPAYSPGSINGQAGWSSPVNNPAVVENTVVQSGAQALYINANNTALTFISAGHPTIAAIVGQTITIMVDFMRSGANQQAGLTLFGNNNAQWGLSSNGTSYHIGNGFTSGAGFNFADDVWHHLSLTVNFSNFTLTGSVDGQSLGMLALLDNATQIQNLQLSSFTTTSRQNVYFDNLLMTSAVPEAGGSAALLGLAAAALGYLRKRLAAASESR